MKLLRLFIWWSVLGVPAAATAQNNPIYHGGQADGSAKEGYTQQPEPSMFKGGAGDGWHFAGYIPDITGAQLFKGGAGDGWATNNYIQSITNIYRGGMGDGYSLLGYMPQYTPVYKGGAADGISMAGSVAPQVAKLFYGGAGDGWSGSALPITALPVNLLSFTGIKHNKEHLLQWTVASDKKIDQFYLERSAATSGFQPLGTLNPKADFVAKNSYSFTDADPLAGNNFYRLRIVEADGHTTYSNTVLLKKLGDNAVISVYPNPAATELNISISGKPDESEVMIDIYDAAGRLTARKTLKQGNNVFTVDVKAFAAGTYFIRVINGEQVSAIPFTKK